MEKNNARRKNIQKLKKDDGTLVTNSQELLEMQKEFYSNLYQSKQEKTQQDIFQYLDKVELPTICEVDRNFLEKPLTINECYETLKTFKNNKSPGNDGLSAEFYKKFWHVFNKYILDSFNQSFKEGELTTSQRHAY